MIADLFPPRIASTLRTQPPEWFVAMREHVLQMSRDCGCDVAAVESALDEAGGIYQVDPPTDLPHVDVLIPFHAGDARWVADAVLSAQLSQHVRPIVHVVADGCEFPFDLQPEVMRYSTPGDWGPYRIQNSLVRHGHCRSEYLAILDADDTMTPERLWRHVALLREHGADMVSSAVRNVAADDSESTRKHLAWQTVVRPAVTFPTCPDGRCVNTCRTMRRSFFEVVNGWSDMRCTGDFALDNRCRPWAKIIDDQHICGTRRVHHRSLSHGVAPMGSPDRQRDIEIVMQHLEQLRLNPTLATAARLGSLNTAPPLTQLASVCETGDRR